METIHSVDHIVRVNHAGERGAISIYRGHLAVSRFMRRSCVEELEVMLGHELVHYQTFSKLLLARNIRPCSALFLWAIGGWVLGLLTAIIGERAIWFRTAAVEEKVNSHLAQQVSYLSANDPEVLAAVESIRLDEEGHEAFAKAKCGVSSRPYAMLHSGITSATALAIWLSTRL